MRVIIAFVRRAAHDRFVYRLDFWLSMVGVFIMMYATHSIWTILYRQSPNAFGMDIERMRTYGVLGVLLLIVMDPAETIQWYIAEQVRTGTLELDLLKPLDFMFHMFSSNIGTLGVVLWTQFAPGLILAWLVLDFRPPPNAQAAIYFIISLALGYLIYFFLSFIMGLLSVVTMDIRSYSWAYYSLVRFTSGQVVPLWMFPAPLGAILGALPFQAVFYLPMSLYIGAYEGSLARALSVQLAWVVVLFLASRLFWARVQQRITIQGG